MPASGKLPPPAQRLQQLQPPPSPSPKPRPPPPRAKPPPSPPPPLPPKPLPPRPPPPKTDQQQQQQQFSGRGSGRGLQQASALPTSPPATVPAPPPGPVGPPAPPAAGAPAAAAAADDVPGLSIGGGLYVVATTGVQANASNIDAGGLWVVSRLHIAAHWVAHRCCMRQAQCFQQPRSARPHANGALNSASPAMLSHPLQPVPSCRTRLPRS